MEWLILRSALANRRQLSQFVEVKLNRSGAVPLSLLNWAYVRQWVYFWAYGTLGCRFSTFSYAKPSDFRRNFRPTRSDEDA